MGDKSNGHLPGFKVAYGAIDFELALVAVGDVHFYERRYKGQLIDLGKFDADIGISFWYTSKTLQPSDTLVVAGLLRPSSVIHPENGTTCRGCYFCCCSHD
ncbi:hypothetical protein L9W73_04930 [Vibrio aestuarianus]|uniref:Uncharacterized protein n=1 Tax=Vibrio aestuarianus TaxID=28171 RepID=A0A9X4FDD4_9VIBR|nr:MULTISPECIES: hypothetical protein [Vibrio]MDE1235321.1 hypothetical protein [Vibrio aestuarianus]MDE1246199.1 hypothetical protein [Vibrio aestuarianus]MDE1331203.1 hypothetical protein [Vibrio aestuarianus]MDE1356655.1 hypothetical protein [Vibrio aestuarianus]MDF9400195.1 hypothetical protein [Vibrio sp. 1180_3]